MSMMEGNPDNGSPTGGGVEQGQAQAQAQTPESWLGSLKSEDLRGSKSLAKFETVEDLALGYVNAESLIGRDKIPVPKTDEEFLAAYDRLGRPKTADDYELSVPGGEYDGQLGEHVAKDLDWFKKEAHRVGLSKKQASELYNGYMANFGEVIRQNEAQVDYEMQAAEAVLKQKFGRDYERNMAVANRALSYLGNPELIKAIEASGLGRNPDFVEVVYRLGMDRQEEIGIDRGGLSGKSLASQLEEAMADPAYTDATHPKHKLAVARVNGLFEQAHPD